ncbi:MAG: FRG domain-containing protein [Acidobacteria bacterium]|nr:FRG domain-containing protein [Acidobacteriota bacterium]
MELRLRSWEHFLKVVTDAAYYNWAFRGQSHESWSLFTALSRYFLDFRIDPGVWAKQEERILRIFKRKAHQHLDQPPALEDDFHWLAFMQHHGAPTRLLDFTWSPYVAAFFALARSLGDGVVWALNPARISSADSTEMDPRVPGNFARHFLKGQKPFIWIGEPHTMNRRLVAQAGTFVIPGVLDRPMEKILEDYDDPESLMAKFILPGDRIRETGLRELYRMNITFATLFPDLDGLARSLGYELEFHWAYDPKTPRQPGLRRRRRRPV